MSAHSDEAMRLLRECHAMLSTLTSRAAPSEPPIHVDLDGPHGDPTVRSKDPRDWTGEPMRGRRFSECPAAYLDLLAQRFDYFNTREDDPAKRRYNALDAARARGWAARVRAGGVTTSAAAGWTEETMPKW